MRRIAARHSANWRGLSASLRKNQADKLALEAFVTRHWDGPFEAGLDESAPPFAFHEFLTGWMAENFGLMAKRAVNVTQQKHGHLAGRMRADVEHVQLTSFEILSVKQTSAARAEACVFMQGQTLKGEVSGKFTILAFRHKVGGDVAMPTDEGIWHVQQGCVFDLMHERTVDKNGR